MMKRLAVGLTLGLLFAVSLRAQIQPYNYWVPPANCQSVVSGNSTGTNGMTVAGASNTPVDQASTSVTGTNTHTYICNVSPPVNLLTNATSNRIRIVDAVFLYGTQSALDPSPAFSGSAGTFNSSLVFSFLNYPVPGASETASSVTPVRADVGTLVMSPAVTSFNINTTTAGAFYSVKFTPATPVNWNTDLQQLLLTITLKARVTYATVTQTPGVLLHIRTN